MKLTINININKEHFYFLVVLVCVLFVLGVSAYNSGSQPAVFGHSDEEIESLSAGKIKQGTFGATVGADTNSLFIFPGNLNVNSNLTTEQDLRVKKNLIIGNGSANSVRNLIFNATEGNINATTKINLITTNVNISNYLTLGGKSIKKWPTDVILNESECITPPEGAWKVCPEGYAVKKLSLYSSPYGSGASDLAVVCCKMRIIYS
ncbi:MAG: hypothetical protein QXG86_00855 [Candidatus Woesearchaeota archaeon]